jgi:hypothetical protein
MVQRTKTTTLCFVVWCSVFVFVISFLDEKNGGDQDQVQSEILEFQIPFCLSRVTFLIFRRHIRHSIPHSTASTMGFCYLRPLSTVPVALP